MAKAINTLEDAVEVLKGQVFGKLQSDENTLGDIEVLARVVNTLAIWQITLCAWDIDAGITIHTATPGSVLNTLTSESHMTGYIWQQEGKEMTRTFTEKQLADFAAYAAVQRSGQINMFDAPNGRRLSGLTKEEYIFVMKNYAALKQAAQQEDV
jgi:hypothetical protein